MQVNRYLHGVLGVAAFLSVVWGAQLTGHWTSSGKITTGGETVQATGQSVDEIKGWMTAGDVAAAYHVPLDELYAAFAVPADTPPSTPLKDFEKTAPGFEVSALRAWLAERK